MRATKAHSSLVRASTTSVHLGDLDTQLFIAFSNHESTGFHWNKQTDPTPSRKKLDLPWIKLTPPPSGTLNSIVFLEIGPLCKIVRLKKSFFLSVCSGPHSLTIIPGSAHQCDLSLTVPTCTSFRRLKKVIFSCADPESFARGAHVWGYF